VSYKEHELITWITRDAMVSVCAPLEWVLMCIWVERLVGISGQDRDGHRAMDKVYEYLALLRDVLLPSA